MKKTLLLLLLFQFSSLAQENKFTIADELNYLVNHPYFRTSQIGVDVYNITQKEIIFRHNVKLLFHPASTMKVITSAAALRFLGTDYKFKTKLKYDGKIEDGVLEGDLYFIGGFDPDFTSADLDTMIFQLSKKGINKISGNIYADVSNMDSLFWGKGWMWDDDPSYHFPYMTPLVINDVSVQIAIAPTNIGEYANITLIPESNYFEYFNNIITVDNDTSNMLISRDWINRSDSLIFEGNIFVNAKPDTLTLNLVNTNQYFLTLTKESLLQNGIELEGKCGIKKTPAKAKLIFVKERLFSDVIVDLNKKSDNLSAEMTLRALAFDRFGKYASAEKGIKLIDSLIVEVGLNPNNYRLVDGSGVSHYNLVSVELLNEILIFMNLYHPELFEVLYKSLPIAGVDGTLKHRMKKGSAHNNVHAKTGSLSGVSALAGYLTLKNGDLISFSINIQNFVGSTHIARSFQDRLCEIISNME